MMVERGLMWSGTGKFPTTVPGKMMSFEFRSEVQMHMKGLKSLCQEEGGPPSSYDFSYFKM